MFILGYIAGLATVIACIVIMNKRLSDQYQMMTERMNQTVAIESDKAYKVGRQHEALAWAQERDNLLYQNDQLKAQNAYIQAENDNMRKMIEDGKLFSNAYQQNGNAVIYFRNWRRENQYEDQRRN